MGPLRIVNVARSRDTGVWENFCCGLGIITRSVLSRTVASVRRPMDDANVEARTGRINRVTIILLVFLFHKCVTGCSIVFER